ncbi:MAG: PglZ domain-containing protein [Anaerolineae bacterium]|nr:PglZ domain-containing protein [Anaerolineae bacterium]
MPDINVPQTVFDLVVQQIAALPDAARLVVVFDPYANLNLGAALETTGRVWQVTRYEGNDLAFHQSYRQTDRDLVWVTGRAGAIQDTTPQTALRSLMAIWRRAELFLDASLPGVLKHLLPGETWPQASVWQQAGILSQNLPAVVEGVKKLRLYLERGASLDAHAIRALALFCLQPTVEIQELLFRHDTAGSVLGAYVSLLWGFDWSADGLALLQTQAGKAHRLELDEIEPWLKAPPASLALYLYLRHMLTHHRVPNIANQLRGLGILDFDPEPLEAEVDSVLVYWDRHADWRRKIIVHAESRLAQEDVPRIIDLLGLRSPQEAFQALLRAETPAIISGLGAHFFHLAFTERPIQVRRFTPAWARRRPPALADLPQTPFIDDTLALARLFDELAIIDRGRGHKIPEQADLATLVDWYIQEGLYDLEYAYARAWRYLLYLPDGTFKKDASDYLKHLHKSIRKYLNELDRVLAERIAGNWSDYLSHPRLSINVLRDLIMRRRHKPTQDARVWIVIFDGMRWDTWVRHVRPRLLDRFEFVVPEKAYLCLLPSWTGVARTGLLAGQVPAGWKNYDGRYTKDQEQLVAKLLELSPGERGRQLRFYSGMESDRKYEQLEERGSFLYNVLVYNVSDDNLHSQRGNLVALNETVDRLLDDILQMIDNLVGADDVVVVSSDHGFAELATGDEISIAEDDRWQRYMEGQPHPVRYRYALTHDLPADLKDIFKVSYPGVRDQYTVTVGKQWFKRAEHRGQADRYAHGGLSFAEMVVPGALFKRITERRIELIIETIPKSVDLDEGDTKTLRVHVTNQGNVPVSGMLKVQSNTAAEVASFSVELGPGDHAAYPYSVQGIYRQRSGSPVERTERIGIELNYIDIDGVEKTRRRQVSVQVTPRQDVVEIDFGGLDDLDI